MFTRCYLNILGCVLVVAQSTIGFSSTMTCLGVELIVVERDMTGQLREAAQRYHNKIYGPRAISLRAAKQTIATAEVEFLKSRGALSPALASVVRGAAYRFKQEREYPVTHRNTTDEDSGVYGNGPSVETSEYVLLPPDSDERPTEQELIAFLDEQNRPM